MMILQAISQGCRLSQEPRRTGEFQSISVEHVSLIVNLLVVI